MMKIQKPLKTWQHPEYHNVYEAFPDAEGRFDIDGQRVKIMGSSRPNFSGNAWEVTGETDMDEHAIEALGATKVASIEIERRFLVDRSLPLDFARLPSSRIEQFYLSADPKRAVRVRIKDGSATLTIKGEKSQGAGIEVETAITLEQATALRSLSLGIPVVKTRYLLQQDGFLFEIDAFDRADGLVIAEIEFKIAAEAASFQPPAWLGREVTDEPNFSNQALALGSLPLSR